jgi:hypothetical protein
MVFPTITQMQMAMIGYSAAQQQYDGLEEYAGDLEHHVEQCRRDAGNLEYRLEQYRQEYCYLLQYTDKLKKLYTSVIGHAQTEHQIEYPLPPAGIVASLKARVTQLNLFEGSGRAMASKEQRVYKSVFAKLDTRSIYCELNLRHFPQTQRMDFDMDFRWYHSELGHFSSKSSSHILPDWEYSWHAHCVGWNEPGNWTKGAYAVSLFIGDEFVVSGTFQIV